VKHLQVIAIFSGLGLATLAHARAKWDLRSDFATTTNPNGQWSYGTLEGGSFVLNTIISPEPYPGWHGQQASNIWKNNSNSVHHGVQPGQVSLHPGSNEQPMVARWTAASFGISRVTGTFFAGDSAELDYAVRHNGIDLWHTRTSGNASFALSRAVNAFDTIDFVVYGGYSFGNTPLEARISIPGWSPPKGPIRHGGGGVVPEPASAFIAVAAVVFARRIRRTR
jgi:hypothetical protein